MTVAVVYPAGRLAYVRRTYTAVRDSCNEAGAELVPVAWTADVADWFRDNGVEFLENIGGSLTDNVRLFMATCPTASVLGRVDDGILVRSTTIQTLLGQLEMSSAEAVAAWPFEEIPPQETLWRGAVTFGGCHVAVAPTDPAAYSEFFPQWATTHETYWSPVRVSLLNQQSRALAWKTEAASVGATQIVEIGLRYGEPEPPPRPPIGPPPVVSGGKIFTNLDLQIVSRVINVPEPVNPGDLVPWRYVTELIDSTYRGLEAAQATVFVQRTLSSLWTINHNLSYFPKVRVEDWLQPYYEVSPGNLTHVDDCTLTLAFSPPLAGIAWLR